MLPRNFIFDLTQDINARNPALTAKQIIALINLLDGENQFAFAPELYQGLRMDINRPFGDGIDNNENGQIDEPGETAAINEDAEGVLGSQVNMDLAYSNVRTAGSDTDPRLIYARHLYMLAMLKLAPVDLDQSGTVEPDENLEFAKAMAQWAVNVVDFRDPDSIYTRFVYDPTPFDAAGWNPTTDAGGNRLPASQISAVWGTERPELLLTETLAVHIQNMEMDDSGTYVQRLRPEPFAYFEVYNPWTQNRLNQTIDQSLYLRFGVELNRKEAEDNESPIWRFEIERAEPRAADADPDDPTRFKPLRYVYMTDPGDDITYTDLVNNNQVADDIEIFYSSGGRTLLRPGRQAVIGTEGFEDNGNFRVFMGRRTNADDAMGSSAAGLMLDQTTRLVIDPSSGPNAGTIERFTGGNFTRHS